MRTTSKKAAERGGSNLNYLKDFRIQNGSNQGQNLALAGLCVPNSLDSGLPVHFHAGSVLDGGKLERRDFRPALRGGANRLFQLP